MFLVLVHICTHVHICVRVLVQETYIYIHATTEQPVDNVDIPIMNIMGKHTDNVLTERLLFQSHYGTAPARNSLCDDSADSLLRSGLRFLKLSSLCGSEYRRTRVIYYILVARRSRYIN